MGVDELGASMKALPKRKGNGAVRLPQILVFVASMKALPKRKGNTSAKISGNGQYVASMKALPKRKGNVTAGYSLCYSSARQ